MPLRSHKRVLPPPICHLYLTRLLGSLTAEKMANLRPGEAYIWSSKATDETFTREAVKIRCRPRVTQHGGDTKTAVGQ